MILAFVVAVVLVDLPGDCPARTGEVFMTSNGLLQIGLYLGVLLACVKPLGWYMAKVYSGSAPLLERFVGPLERLLYRLCGIDKSGRDDVAAVRRGGADVQPREFRRRLRDCSDCRTGCRSIPEALPAVSPDSSFNTAVSFATNTNWQGYGGETTMSYLTQMLALTVQNFVSAAAGMAVLVALIRGFTRHTTDDYRQLLGRSGAGNALHPAAAVAACWRWFWFRRGWCRRLIAYHEVTLLEPTVDAEGKAITTQKIAVGPAASQVAIKQLGTNGGGFFNVNSAHPLENPTPLSNFLQMLAILLIPAALCYTFGEMVGDRRQGWAILAAMLVIFVPLLLITTIAEQAGNPDPRQTGRRSNGDSNLSRAETWKGRRPASALSNSSLWAVATTAASNGSVNSMHDSFTPLGGLVPMWLMQLGEVIFGGVGSGLYGMLMFAIVAVFISGLMVGRTPEYSARRSGRSR